MSPLLAFYTGLSFGVLVLAIAMPFLHRREKQAAVLVAGLIFIGSVLSHWEPIRMMGISIYIFADFVVATTALMLVLRRPRAWCGCLFGITVILLSMGIWAEANNYTTNLLWAWVNNSLIVGQLSCVVYTSMSHTVRRSWIRHQRKKDPTYGTVWGKGTARANSASIQRDPLFRSKQ